MYNNITGHKAVRFPMSEFPYRIIFKLEIKSDQIGEKYRNRNYKKAISLAGDRRLQMY